MDYSKLVWRLRKRAFEYQGEKAIQFDRILKEAIKRKVKAYHKTDKYLMAEMEKSEMLLFRTR